jgi:hypothetical protein
VLRFGRVLSNCAASVPEPAEPWSLAVNSSTGPGSLKLVSGRLGRDGDHSLCDTSCDPAVQHPVMKLLYPVEPE